MAAISPQRLTVYLYSAHRTIIFAIAQLSCISDVRTLKQVQDCFSSVLKKYSNEAETVSVFYFSFISPCATGFI